MSERLMRNPLALAGLLVLSALLGAGIFALIQPRVAAPATAGGEAIRAYLLEHPEVLPEAMERLQAREAAKAEQAQRGAQAAVPRFAAALNKPYAGAWAGNPKGDVTVVAFLDYACGYCRASVAGVAELIARDPNVRVVYREYPVLGPDSVTAARWALAAAEQGKFAAFHEALYAGEGPSAGGIAAAAQRAGLDKARAQAAIQSKAVEAEIVANRDLGARLAMTGTPSWVVGGRLLYGMRDYAGLAAAVAAARAGK
jgi:protein-disulfide isomerase